MKREDAKNVLGGPLETCGTNPVTGYFRDGCCTTGPTDHGAHVVCVKVNEEFLSFSRSQGNDLTTPYPQYNFPGLKPGDRWCLCASRWVEAHKAGLAPKLFINATHERVLDFVDVDTLLKYAIDLV
ncbi:MAG: DUF2237 domain-containing protein [Deltaproteobacteria bacterium]|nr:MAG: DUF2237 domain-containing protein [Deltaproteobacteria bacterium]